MLVFVSKRLGANGRCRCKQTGTVDGHALHARSERYDGVTAQTSPGATERVARDASGREECPGDCRTRAHGPTRTIRRRSRRDAIARTTGSAPFAVVHLAWFGSWVLLNTGRIPGITPFDPYPFSFLTLVVSLEAIFLSVFV